MRATPAHRKLVEKINTLAPLVRTRYLAKLFNEHRTGGLLFTLVATTDIDVVYVRKTLEEYDKLLYIEEYEDELDLLALAILLDAYKVQLADKLHEFYAEIHMLDEGAKQREELIEILERDNAEILDDYRKKQEVMRV